MSRPRLVGIWGSVAVLLGAAIGSVNMRARQSLCASVEIGAAPGRCGPRVR